MLPQREEPAFIEATATPVPEKTKMRRDSKESRLITCGLEGIRTLDLSLRRRTLYPLSYEPEPRHYFTRPYDIRVHRHHIVAHIMSKTGHNTPWHV